MQRSAIRGLIRTFPRIALRCIQATALRDFIKRFLFRGSNTVRKGKRRKKQVLLQWLQQRTDNYLGNCSG
jgi:hypothetical protein